MPNPYLDLCIVTQAIRRDSERLRGPLVTALGVAASVYTHQLANTQRVLTDLRVRHLLADEVGLGKTVQALMILNALRCERPSLRALIIVPDRLVPQWRDELLTRAHIVPTDQDIDAANEDDIDGSYGVRLAWEAQLKKPSEQKPSPWTIDDIDPERYDILIVDELHKLITPLQERIIRVAPTFGHVLILTATPSFQLSSHHAQLFAALEPERYEIARWEVLNQAEDGELSTSNDPSKWPEATTNAIVEFFLDRDRSASLSHSDESDLEITAQIHCAYRRVIRTRRLDYSGALPLRKHFAITAEPLDAEQQRQALMWRYFAFLGELAREFDPILLAKRVILSPPSLEQRVDFLRRKGHDREGILARVKPLVHRSNGDSRLDALIDILAEVWRGNPTERVLIAAQDNLTVDYLFDEVQKRLPWVGPISGRVRLQVARIRQGMATDAVYDIAGFGNETQDNIEAFQRGDAQILFAPEAAQVGLNLQCARVLILYSVPWRPGEVEQWIGRLDRIGNAAAFSLKGEAKTIDVYTITQRGLVDEKVVGVLQQFRVFERGINLDGEHLDEVARRIEQAALRQADSDWESLGAQTSTMAAENGTHELNSPLISRLPWSVGWAKSLREEANALVPLEPVSQKFKGYADAGPHALDHALGDLLKLLRCADEYHIRPHEEPSGYKFKTLWYKFGEVGMYRQRSVRSRIIFSFGADPSHERSPEHAHALITRRDHIGTPPRRSVTMALNEGTVRRPLRFLSFGDQLHDELVRGWAALNPGWLRPDVNPREAKVIEVTLAKEHALLSSAGPGLYLVRLLAIDSAARIIDNAFKGQIMDWLAQRVPTIPANQLAALMVEQARHLSCALEADARWLRVNLPGGLRVEVLWLTQPGCWQELDESSRRALLIPNMKMSPSSGHTRLSAAEAPEVADALAAAQGRDAATAKTIWSERLPSFDTALSARIAVLDAEASDVETLARLEIADAERRLSYARAQNNTAQINRVEASLRLIEANLRVTMARLYERRSWLESSSQWAQSAPVEVRGIALLRVLASR